MLVKVLSMKDLMQITLAIFSPVSVKRKRLVNYQQREMRFMESNQDTSALLNIQAYKTTVFEIVKYASGSSLPVKPSMQICYPFPRPKLASYLGIDLIKCSIISLRQHCDLRELLFYLELKKAIDRFVQNRK